MFRHRRDFFRIFSAQANSVVRGAHHYRDTQSGPTRPSAASSSAVQNSIVATDRSIGSTIRMPVRWRFAAWRVFARCCFGAFWLAGRRRLPAACGFRFGFLCGLAGYGYGRCWSENKTGAISALAVRGDGDVPASTNQRAGVSALTAGVAAGLRRHVIEHHNRDIRLGRFHARCEDGLRRLYLGRRRRRCRLGRGRGPESVGGEREVTSIANNNANASHMTVCFIVASRGNRIKIRPYPPSPGSTLHSFKITRAG